ncbi:MAG: XRE family transcriptional regulator [Gammaproteobacteria bacterium]|nr:XRE family transcriptional regulator [Gammaproteobacteria bacterium]
MPAKALKKADQLIEKMMLDMPLQELRQARSLSQERLAKLLDTKQANISRIEKRADMYISTLRSYVQAMGGELQIIAHFPEGNVRINQFQEI